MKLKKYSWDLITFAGLAGLVLGMWYIFEGPTGYYIVTDKYDSKIKYRSVSNYSADHIMTFEADTGHMSPGFYPYIKIGDTISGPARFMDKPFVSSQIMYVRPPSRVFVIKKINGMNMKDIIREMNQKQR